MKTVAFFNNKGGVGKTSLVYHLAWMLSEKQHRVLAADFDPQANLTSICLSEDRLEEIWHANPKPTVSSSVAPLKRGTGDIRLMPPESINSRFALLIGDLALSEFADDLSDMWSKCVDRDERAFRVTTAFARLVEAAGTAFDADIALIDVGPNLGAINRAVLLAADYVVIPATPDPISVQGLEIVGSRLRTWRSEWSERLQRAPDNVDFKLPSGKMQPVGYVVSRHSMFEGRQAKAFRKWLDRLPKVYRDKVEHSARVPSEIDIDKDDRCLAQLKDYRSLMPMSQEARRPMFLLRPADGAIGGHQGAVRACYEDFSALADRIAERIDLPEPL